jgi:hypothetical protein
MSQIVRQNNLFAAEDWKTVYRTFSQANFTAYDYDSIRSTMLNYISVNYPEDFNDYIQSSEFIAIIDLVAYLGQSIAFRTDLNSRENFLDTAERRDSIIRLAKLINYRTKRNVPARGILKITKILTSEPLEDSNGNELSNTSISWNDSTNADWYDQWLTICNSMFNSTNQFGNPTSKKVVGGVPTEIYNVNSQTDTSVVKPISVSIDGVNTKIDIVKASINTSNYLEERSPDQTDAFTIIYRNNNQGFGSVDTGFFVYFKEGELEYQDQYYNDPIPNRVLSVDKTNINDLDVWVQKVSSGGVPIEKWKKVPSLFGQNTIYNSLALSERNIFNVQSENNDKIKVLFADGNFGNAPKGNIRVWYRRSKGKGQVLRANRIQNKEVTLTYLNKEGQEYQATLSLTLTYTVNNSSDTETNANIKNNAPVAFYTQDRMVNAEDYAIFPLTQSQTIQKIKTINRTHIGHSRYLDTNDPTGTVKNVNVFGEDGILYKNPNFTLATEEITGIISDNSSYSYIINSVLEPLLKKPQLKNFYFDTYKKAVETDHDSDQFEMDQVSVNQVAWQPYPVSGSSNVGFFYIGNAPVLATGRPNSAQLITVFNNPYSSNEKLAFIRPGAKLEFVDSYSNPTTIKWATVVSVTNDGTILSSETTGSITLDQEITAGLKVRKVLPAFRTTLSTDEKALIQAQMEAGLDFGIGYHYRDLSTTANKWYVIGEDFVDTSADFTVKYNQSHGGYSSLGEDASWLIRASYIPASDTASSPKYVFTVRGLEYVFESDNEVRFFYVDKYKNISTQTGKAIKDTIKILDINKDVDVLSNPASTTKLTNPVTFELSEEFVEQDGYVDTKKVKIANYDSDDDGMPDNPIGHELLINDTNFVFFNSYSDYNGYTYYKINKEVSQVDVLTGAALEFLTTDQQFYLNNTKLNNGTSSQYTKRYGVSGNTIYKAYTGRTATTSEPFYFQYKHSAPRTQRVDPSVSNIIEMIVLQTSYYTNIQNWFAANKTAAELPVQPTATELKESLAELEKYKTIGDQIVYSPAKFKLLFGKTANVAKQATFRVVKILGATFTDNQIKTGVVNAINDYFNIANWDFGDTFFFTELSAYIHNQLSSQISSVVIVPNDSESKFGNLFQIRAEPNELFFSTASVEDVEIVVGLTGNNLNPSMTDTGSY